MQQTNPEKGFDIRLVYKVPEHSLMMVKSESSKSDKHSEGVDRISSLPEPLLSGILSLLPTKYAVATSVLSKRWRFLWTSITNLKFDDENAQRRYPNDSLDMNRMKFTKFVNRVLLLLNPPCIQDFQLKCHHELCDPFYLDAWICAAMGRAVQKLELHLMMAQSVELPLNHFYCKTLAVLKLSGGIHFKISAEASICFPNLLILHLSDIEFTVASNCSVSFPSLKDLLLDSVRYTNTESVHKLFASCSVLDNLVIKRNDWDNAHCLVICIPSLRSLTILFKRIEYNWLTDANLYKLHIDTPALKYLHVEDDSMYCFTTENLSSLLEARIAMRFYEMSTIVADHYDTHFVKFIRGLFNAKFLSISGDTLEAISSTTAVVAPVFCNLTRLELSQDGCCDWSVVVKNLIQRMDNLEHLVLKGLCMCEVSEYWWTEPLKVPMCLLHRVTTISLLGTIYGFSDEVELVRYFLKNAKVLKLLTVDSIGGSDEEKLKLKEKILTSPRGSQECQVDVGVGVLGVIE